MDIGDCGDSESWLPSSYSPLKRPAAHLFVSRSWTLRSTKSSHRTRNSKPLVSTLR